MTENTVVVHIPDARYAEESDGRKKMLCGRTLHIITSEKLLKYARPCRKCRGVQQRWNRMGGTYDGGEYDV